MCLRCWEEAGSPTELPDDAEELLALIDELYKIEPTGGPLHIVLDDWNLEEAYIEWCLVNVNRFNPTAQSVELSVSIGLRLFRISEQQRYAVMATHWRGTQRQ